MLFNVVKSRFLTLRRYPTVRGISTIVEEPDRVVMTDDGTTIVCWHPEKPFPYECSKPLPVVKNESLSVLNVESKEELYRVFKHKKKHMVVEELAKLTFTMKHQWYPKPKKIKRRFNHPEDRPYL